MPALAHHPFSCAIQSPPNSTFLIQFSAMVTLVGEAACVGAGDGGLITTPMMTSATMAKRRSMGRLLQVQPEQLLLHQVTIRAGNLAASACATKGMPRPLWHVVLRHPTRILDSHRFVVAFTDTGCCQRDVVVHSRRMTSDAKGAVYGLST